MSPMVLTLPAGDGITRPQFYTTIFRVADPERSAAWYARHLDLQPEFRDLGYPLVLLASPSGSRLALWKADAGEAIVRAGREGGFAAFVTTDAAATHGHFMREGAEVSALDDSQPGVTFFWATDPDGHAVLVIQLLQE
jgi:catechol 2,3-dioxygenase-like lactoylglutathione lyase family enzyme